MLNVSKYACRIVEKVCSKADTIFDFFSTCILNRHVHAFPEYVSIDFLPYPAI